MRGGAGLGRAGLNRKTAVDTITLAISAEIPDVDIAAFVKGPVVAFACHRGFTHTFLGVPFDAALALGIVYLLWRLFSRWNNHRKPALKEPHEPDSPPLPWQVPRWGLLFIYACIGVLSHILLDCTNAYRFTPFSPFSPNRSSLYTITIHPPP